jgi:hypothetical protein
VARGLDRDQGAPVGAYAAFRLSSGRTEALGKPKEIRILVPVRLD